jgi:peptide/nickel transport system substrate-binding protein
MSKGPLAVRGVALAAVLALAATACGGSSSGGGSTSKGSNGGSTNSALTGTIQGTLGGYGGGKVPINPGGTKGGQLNIVSDGDVDYMDPARTYYAFSWDFHQLINRTVLTYPDSADPKQGLQLVGDIATGPATGQQNNTVWTYTIKSGIKYQDGTPVTPDDIKYAIERTFATDVINGGPTYFATFLQPANGPKYKGPYTDKDPKHLGLSTITTTANTITFHLNQPFAEWNYVMTLFGTSPVPQKVDLNKATGGANYNNHVVATGPYEIASYVANKHINLVRNPNYDPSTDGTRPAYPNTIQMLTNLSDNAKDSNIEAGTADVDMDGTGVQATEQTKILSNPSLKARSLDPVTGFTRYVTVFTKVAPFTNVHCRRALEYAINKQEQVRARGGAVGGGAPATTMAPPSLAGYVKFDLYPTTNFSGDVQKAKSELQQCGQPNGFSTTIVTTNTDKGKTQAEFLQQDLAKVGIKAQIKQFDPATYYSAQIGVPANVHKNHYGLALAGWGPDWPAPYGFFENIVDPQAILPQGNSNYSECDDPQIRTLIKKALSEPTLDAELADWGQVDKQVLTDACNVPVTYDKALDLFSARLKNVYIQPAFGIVDIRTVAVQ